jgi:hypothetical protein
MDTTHASGSQPSPAEMITAVPFLLGYRPDDKLVILAMAQGQMLATTAIDLSQTVAEQITAAREIASTLLVLGATECGVVAFGTPQRLVVDRLISGLTQSAIPVPVAVRVSGNRYHSYLPGHDGPPEGTPLTVARTITPAFLDGIGLATEPDAPEVTASLRPLDPLHRAAMGIATSEAVELTTGAHEIAPGRARGEHRRATFRYLRHAIDSYATGGHLSDIAAATLSIQVQDPRIREEALALIRHHGTPAAHLALWTDLARRAMEPYTPRLLTLLAFAAWQHGDRVRAAIAIERAHRATPEDPLTAEVANAVANGTRPEELRVATPAELARQDHAAGETAPDNPGNRG